jgi:DinB family protein
MDPKYPIGKFSRPKSLDGAAVDAAVATIAETPARMRAAIAGLSPAQLDTPYRDGGWTVRQLVHHVPESHLNAYTRCKLALTEDVPTIKPYAEDQWAKTPEVSATPIDVSLTLLDALHTRWVILLRALGPTQWARTFRHPESGTWRVDELAALYAWHGSHHIAHVTNLRQQRGW